MSLFVINRYQGETREETKDETNHLSELLKRIEERKKQKLAATEAEKSFQSQDLQADNELQSKKKKKKRKSLLETPATDTDPPDTRTQVNGNDINETICEELQVPKKKKKKKYKNEEDTVPQAVETQEVNGDIENINKYNKKDDTENIETDNKEATDQQVSLKQASDFMILGAKSHKRTREVRRVLPDWLAHPEVVSIDLNSGPRLDELDSVLDSQLIEVLKANGIIRLFPVQASTVSWLLKCNNDRRLGWWPRDTCVSAPTGSGKTLAYVLPIVQELQVRLVPKIRCLVVVPVQELAAQVHKVMVTYTSHTSLKVGLLTGACSFEQEQTNILRKTGKGEYVCTVDIIIATPGRLIDHILKTPGFSLDALRFLVIDEADRAMDWLQYLPEAQFRAPTLSLGNIRSRETPPVQKLLFSATLSQDPEKLNRFSLFHPILFTSVVISGKDHDVDLDKEVNDYIGRYTSPEELTEVAVQCATEYKPIALYELLTRGDAVLKALVFTNSGEAAHRLALLIQSLLTNKSITVGELSAQLVPKQRENILRKFAEGEIQVLISSDALARGVDIPNVQLVISYDLPKHIKGYIHRAGRTGRAGNPGTAVSILQSNQVGFFKHMLEGAHKIVPKIEEMNLEGLADSLDYQSHVEKLKEILEKEKAKNMQQIKIKKQRHKIRFKPDGNKE